MSSSTAVSGVKVPTELPLAVVLCLLVLGAGCSASAPDDVLGGSNDYPDRSDEFDCAPTDADAPSGQVDVYVVNVTEELEDAGAYTSSPVSNVDAVDEAVNDAKASVGDESATDDVVLASATEELTGEEVYGVYDALNASESVSRPDDSAAPGGAYFADGDHYVVVSLAVYC